MKKILLITLLVVSSLLVYKIFFSHGNLSAGAMAPNIETSLISGESFQLSDLKGKYVLIDFWGSWCGALYQGVS